MKPELQKLFEGVNGLSTDFLDKVSGLLESKVDAARVAAIQETEAAAHEERLKLVEAHQAEIAALKESNLEEMATAVDSFLNAVVAEWANTNAPAIDAMIKTEAAENLLTGLTGVLKEAGISFATDAEGQIAALTRRLAESEQSRRTAEYELSGLKESEVQRQRESVIDRICEGLVATKKATVAGLLEGIEFKNESEFAGRVQTFRNLVEGKKSKKKEGDDDFKDNVGKDDENLDEGKKSKKKEGDDGDDDDEDDDELNEGKKSKKKEGDDGDDDEKGKDDTDSELNESVRRQLESYRQRYSVNG